MRQSSKIDFFIGICVIACFIALSQWFFVIHENPSAVWLWCNMFSICESPS